MCDRHTICVHEHKHNHDCYDDHDESENKELLQRSLDNIEQTVPLSTPNEAGKLDRRNSSKRCSRRMLGISLELSDVEEDDGLKSSKSNGGEGQDKLKTCLITSRGTSFASGGKHKTTVQGQMKSQHQLSVIVEVVRRRYFK